MAEYADNALIKTSSFLDDITVTTVWGTTCLSHVYKQKSEKVHMY